MIPRAVKLAVGDVLVGASPRLRAEVREVADGYVTIEIEDRRPRTVRIPVMDLAHPCCSWRLEGKQERMALTYLTHREDEAAVTARSAARTLTEETGNEAGKCPEAPAPSMPGKRKKAIADGQEAAREARCVKYVDAERSRK